MCQCGQAKNIFLNVRGEFLKSCVGFSVGKLVWSVSS